MSGTARWAAVAVVATVAGAIAAWIVWHGPVQYLDAGSYAAAIDAVSSGRGITSELAPSFSAFSGVEFLRRGGSIPFVDFPAGYPLVAAVPALAVSAKTAMLAVGVVSSAALAALLVVGPRPIIGGWALASRAVVAIAVVALPIHRSVLAAGLSEPLFLALVVLAAKLSVDALDDDDGRRAEWAVLAAALAGLVRFVGVLLVVVPLVVLWRRRGAAAAARWALVGVGPVALNLLWASAQGSGHRLGVRTIDTADGKFFVHAVGGWLWHGSGSFDLANAAPPWWQLLAVVAWCAAVAVAMWAMFSGRLRLHPALAVCGSMAGLLAVGVAAAMLLFDSLVTLDNRLMLPSGVLTIAGLSWWATARPLPRWAGPGLLGATTVWGLLVVGPWDIDGLRGSPATPGLLAAVDGADVVLSDDADHVWWSTGTPAAYLPGPRDLLTGESVDVAAALAPVPCLLAAERGVIVVFGGPFSDPTAPLLLEELVAGGELTAEQLDRLTVYRPARAAC